MMDVEIHKKAFQLKENNLSEESILEFGRILESDGDPFNISDRMIAALYYYRLADHESALPYAITSVSNSPLDEMDKEIRRFVSAGGKIDLFKSFIEDNGAQIIDFK